MQIKCPHCGNDDKRMIEWVATRKYWNVYFCGICSKRFEVGGN